MRKGTRSSYRIDEKYIRIDLNQKLHNISLVYIVWLQFYPLYTTVFYNFHNFKSRITPFFFVVDKKKRIKCSHIEFLGSPTVYEYPSIARMQQKTHEFCEHQVQKTWQRKKNLIPIIGLHLSISLKSPEFALNTRVNKSFSLQRYPLNISKTKQNKSK